MQYGYIYMIKNQKNGKKYIGQTNNIKRRWAEHCNLKRKNNQAINYAIYKYGKENFNFKIIEKCTQDKMNEREKYWIDRYDTYKGNGYNCHIGGSNYIGDEHPNSKIDLETAINILENRKNGLSQRELARKFDISQRVIQRIIKGKHGICMKMAELGYIFEDISEQKITDIETIKSIIIDRYINKKGYKYLVKKYGIARGNIQKIINGKHINIDKIKDQSILDLLEKDPDVIPYDNTSGKKGICFVKSRDKWLARINKDGKRKYLGYYNNKKDAIKARVKAEEKLKEKKEVR